MNILKTGLFSITACAVLSGCMPVQQSSNYQNQQVYQQQQMRQYKQENAKLKQSVEQQNAQVGAHLNAMGNQMAMLQAQVAMMEEKITSLENQMADQNSAYAAQLAAERKQREEQLKQLTSKVSSEITSVSDIMKRNQQRLAKEIQNTRQTAAASGSDNYYVVQSGDTLSVIAKAAGTTVSRLKQINGLSSDIIRIGQKLRLP